MLRISTCLFPLVLLAASPALAQDDDPYAPCAAMGEDAARLACFDATFAEQRVVRAEEAERRIEEERLAEQRRIEEARLAEQRRIEEERLAEERAIAEYGLEDRDADREITSEVVDVFTDRSGRALVTLENGQIWREVGGSSMRYAPESGTATIEPHWSGAYTMRFEGRRGFLRVQRYR